MNQILRAFTLALSLLAFPALADEVPMGDDGLHKPDWLKNSFKDLPEDNAEAGASNRLLLLMVEQRGCIYCAEMHNQVLTDPKIEQFIRDHFDVVQVDLFGGTELTDTDGDVLTEKRAAAKWGVTVTPTLMLMPREPVPGKDAARAAIAVVPGVLGADHMLAFLEWGQAGGPQSGRDLRAVLGK